MIYVHVESTDVCITRHVIASRIHIESSRRLYSYSLCMELCRRNYIIPARDLIEPGLVFCLVLAYLFAQPSLDNGNEDEKAKNPAKPEP